jgi:hypothetical protein
MINFLQKKLESGIEEEATSYNLITLKLMKNLLSKLETTNDLELGSDCFKAVLNLLKRIYKSETYEYSDELIDLLQFNLFLDVDEKTYVFQQVNSILDGFSKNESEINNLFDKIEFYVKFLNRNGLKRLSNKLLTKMIETNDQFYKKGDLNYSEKLRNLLNRFNDVEEYADFREDCLTRAFENFEICHTGDEVKLAESMMNAKFFLQLPEEESKFGYYLDKSIEIYEKVYKDDLLKLANAILKIRDEFHSRSSNKEKREEYLGKAIICLEMNLKFINQNAIEYGDNLFKISEAYLSGANYSKVSEFLNLAFLFQDLCIK